MTRLLRRDRTRRDTTAPADGAAQPAPESDARDSPAESRGGDRPDSGPGAEDPTSESRGGDGSGSGAEDSSVESRGDDGSGSGEGDSPAESRGGVDPGPGTDAEDPASESRGDGPGPGPGGGGSRAESAGDAPDPGPDSGGTGPGEEATGPRPSRGRLRAIALAGLAVVLVLAGCGFLYGAHRLRSAPSAGNHALTDTEATTRVAGDIGEDLARVFSYTPDGLDATERSARSVLTGRAARQYTQLLDRIRADVTEQGVTLSTQAVRTGVIRLDGDDARLLVFLDQVSRRGKGAGTSAAAQLTVTAHREDGQWRIVDITTR